MAFEGESPIWRHNDKVPPGPEHPVDLFKSTVLVRNVFEYLIHKDAVEGAVRKRYLIIFYDTKTDMRVRLSGSLNPVDSDVHPRYCGRA